ncbi:effector binding domain-containing protein [Paenibacillus sp. sgz500958]|uniref:effector binding domain-containing protein n=1 Tax=Paenibacillus sp. sgz500958 TaxID=3242475 RepID=UPI0036D3066C
MDWLDRMNSAIEYIETHLDQEVDFEQVAQKACCSVHHFQRMFSFITDVPLSEYIRRRRLTLAAFELQTRNARVIDVALKYGYESPEAFSRAFRNLHGIMPTSARNEGTSLKAYPRISFHISIKGDIEMNYRIVTKEAFEMAGISVEMSAVDNQQYTEIPRLWETYTTDGTIDRMRKDFEIPEEECVHAALYNFREGVFSYMIGALPPAGAVIEEYTVLKVPALTWAIFPTGECTPEDETAAIQDVWRRIFSEWFPTSGYEHADGPEFEMYYKLGNGLLNEEVWIPVVKK